MSENNAFRISAKIRLRRAVWKRKQTILSMSHIFLLICACVASIKLSSVNCLCCYHAYQSHTYVNKIALDRNACMPL